MILDTILFIVYYLSILYLRCDLTGITILVGKSLSFNSLFEMLGVLVLGLCGFLNFVGGGMGVLLWRVL